MIVPVLGVRAVSSLMRTAHALCREVSRNGKEYVVCVRGVMAPIMRYVVGGKGSVLRPPVLRGPRPDEPLRHAPPPPRKRKEVPVLPKPRPTKKGVPPGRINYGVPPSLIRKLHAVPNPAPISVVGRKGVPSMVRAIGRGSRRRYRILPILPILRTVR